MDVLTEFKDVTQKRNFAESDTRADSHFYNLQLLHEEGKKNEHVCVSFLLEGSAELSNHACFTVNHSS